MKSPIINCISLVIQSSLSNQQITVIGHFLYKKKKNKNKKKKKKKKKKKIYSSNILLLLLLTSFSSSSSSSSSLNKETLARTMGVRSNWATLVH